MRYYILGNMENFIEMILAAKSEPVGRQAAVQDVAVAGLLAVEQDVAAVGLLAVGQGVVAVGRRAAAAGRLAVEPETPAVGIAVAGTVWLAGLAS